MMNCGERMVESSRCEEPESERICFQQNLDLFWEFPVAIQRKIGEYGRVCRFRGVQKDREIIVA